MCMTKIIFDKVANCNFLQFSFIRQSFYLRSAYRYFESVSQHSESTLYRKMSLMNVLLPA